MNAQPPVPAEALQGFHEFAVERLARLATRPYRRGVEHLALGLGPEVDDGIEVLPYDYREYRARHDGVDPPAPRYVLALRHDSGAENLRLAVDHASVGGSGGTVEVTIPAHTEAGGSIVLPLADDPELRLLRLRLLGFWPVAPAGGRFRLTTLLGNFAKLLWVLGAEKDAIGQRLAEVARQRSLTHAAGASLDLHGRDLRVPRFPPRPYSFDPDTVALYHFDTPFTPGGEIAEETVRFGRPGHPAIDGGAQTTAGFFGDGLRLEDGGHLRIPHHSDFALGPGRDFTVELLVRLETESTGVQTLVTKAALDGAGRIASNGWALTVGAFRGFDHNPYFGLRRGPRTVELFADRSLEVGRFHHLAAVVDRTRARCRLLVDGVEAAVAAIDDFRAVTTTRLVRVGQAGGGAHPLNATIDELRFSSRARDRFAPLLGESDSSYRRRLGLFGGWLLPTATNLEQTLNSAISIEGDPRPFVVEEHDRALRSAVAPLRVVPRSLPRRGHLDHDGDPRRTIDQVAGTLRDAPAILPSLLQEREDPRLVVVGGGPARLQHVTARALDALLDLLEALGETGPLEVLKAYDPDAEDLHRVGRALRLRHPSLGHGVLAARCHRAGFDWVHNPGDGVEVASAAGPLLEIAAHRVDDATPVPPEVAGVAGETLDLTVVPGSLPAAARFEWTVIPCGLGEARLTLPEDGSATGLPVERRRRVRLELLTAGTVTLAVEVRHRGVTARGHRRFVIEPTVPAVEEDDPPTLAIVRSDTGGAPPRVLEVGESVELTLEPPELLDDTRLAWSVDPVGFGRGDLSSVFRRQTTLTARVPGLLVLTALAISQGTETPPYTFSVRLNDALEETDARIPKSDYDLLMNILHHFHPIGVEVRTERIRERVVEVRDDLLQAFAGYTYPEFRVPGGLP